MDHACSYEQRKTAVSARTLEMVARCVRDLPVTRRQDLDPGDCVIVSTKNSVYRLTALGDDLFHAAGGWFDRAGTSTTVTINGCTFGGSVICTDIVAARGLFLEFGNRVSTTRIRSVRVVKRDPTVAERPN